MVHSDRETHAFTSFSISVVSVLAHFVLLLVMVCSQLAWHVLVFEILSGPTDWVDMFKENKNKKNYTLVLQSSIHKIRDMLGIFIDDYICSHVSTTIDPFWDISLDLGPTEADAARRKWPCLLN